MWSHPLLSPKLLGGMTTQNTDAEWSDNRQSYLALTLLGETGVRTVAPLDGSTDPSFCGARGGANICARWDSSDTLLPAGFPCAFLSPT